MDSPKYLIIITLIDGQNFTVPDGAPDKIEASVFAEARFGNESILKSDPIKLTNSNPEFVTELAWQLDKRSLHQLRVERRSIKLQVFMQTREKKKASRQNSDQATSNGLQSTDDSSLTHKVELIGYTILDIRSAQDREQPKFKWLPLLNPKFKKSSYNRPEVQLAVSLNRIDEGANSGVTNPLPSTSTLPKTDLKTTKNLTESLNSDLDSPDIIDTEHFSDDSRLLYKTCLDITSSPNQVERDEIIENDINIISKDGCFYIYDTRNSIKSTINDCDEKYRITITIPFNSELDSLVLEPKESYYFSVSLFGSSLRTDHFKELTSVETKEVEFIVFTTHSSVLTTYFELNSSLLIKLHDNTGEPLGITTIQLDQLCSLDSKCRSIEGIFALQSMFEHDIPSAIHPSIGVSIVLERVDTMTAESLKLTSEDHIQLARQHFGDDIDDYFFKTLNDTHQLTIEDTANFDDDEHDPTTSKRDFNESGAIQQEDHHFCFTIDLKNFSYTPTQRLIPTLRELVVRFAYPFFGYKDPITTDASIPISKTNSIIVSGFCEFNFATTVESLITALKEIPLDLEILTCEHSRRIEIDSDPNERVVATCSMNLAQTMCLTEENINQIQEKAISTTVSAPIYGLNGDEIGELQVYLCLKDLGHPSHNIKSSIENQNNCGDNPTDCIENPTERPAEHREERNQNLLDTTQQLEQFIQETRNNLESWKDDYANRLSEEVRKRENERFKRLCQRFEVKEAKREQEFKKKMDDLNSLERRLKNSVCHVESLEKRLSNAFDQLRTKDALFDTKLETIDLKISKAINDIKLEDRRMKVLPYEFHRFPDDNVLETRSSMTRITTKQASELNQVRRSSMKNSTNTPGIPMPVRSSSLVRGQIESSTSTRLVKRPTGVTTTVVNGVSSRPRSNSTRITLSREAQEKLTSLRKEKAELLKRGCRPNDELIQEINSLIEKLAC